MAMAAAAAAAVAAASRAALMRPLHHSSRVAGLLVKDVAKVERETHLVQVKPFCTSTGTTPPPPPPPVRAPPPPQPDKIDQVLELLKERGSEATLKGLQERVGRLEAKVYYGGILFGALAATVVGFPLVVKGLQNSCGTIDRNQRNTEKVIEELNSRLKVLETERGAQKVEYQTVPAVGDECAVPGDNSSWMSKLMSYVIGA